MGMVLLAPGLPGQPTKRITLGAPYVSGRESLWVSADNGKQGSRYETNQPFEVKALTTVPYTYVATPTADIPTLVSRYAGPQ